MTVLLSPDIYIQYLNNLRSYSGGNINAEIKALINNINNVQVLSRAHLDQIESHFDKGDFDQLYSPILMEIFNNSRNVTAGNPASMSETLDNMISNNQLPQYSLGIEAVIVLKAQNAPSNASSIVIEKTKKPSAKWVLYKLACNNPQPVTLRYFDFASDKQVSELFDAVLKIEKSNNFVSIFDRQTNLEHALFKGLLNRNVHYYTAKPKEVRDQINTAKNIVNRVPRAKVFYAKKNIIHERRIMFDNLIIEVDDDFWMLQVTRPTWKIDITYCPITVAHIRTKTADFTRFTFK